jgi:F-type H+-transporting ATPase subunit a
VVVDKKKVFYFILVVNQKYLEMFIYEIILSPLDQFEIRNLFSIDTLLLANMNLSITNIGLYMTIAAFLAFYFSILSTNHSRITPNK